LLVQIPLTVGILMLVGITFGISFGWLWTGIVKLVAISLFGRGLFAIAYALVGQEMPAAAAIVGLIGLLAQIWLLKTLFELDVFETLVCLVVVGLALAFLQFLALTLLMVWLRPMEVPAAVAAQPTSRGVSFISRDSAAMREQASRSLASS
jgi:hypothetical protein